MDMARLGLQSGRYPANKPTARYRAPVQYWSETAGPVSPGRGVSAMRQRFGCCTRAVVSPKAVVALDQSDRG